MEQETLVLYDIEDDKARLRVAEDCKDAGLKRIQMSAFRGPVTRTRRGELAAKLAARVAETKGRILLVALCEKDARAIVEIENAEMNAAAKREEAELTPSVVPEPGEKKEDE